MSPTDKFCLKWNDFQENISSTFQGLFNVDDFSDVTLACEDDQFVETHKVVLSASSPFFMKILKRTKHKHPIIYLRGIKSKDLTHILEFMYHGQVNVYEEDLQHFLALAQELQLKGLGGMEKQGDQGPEVMKSRVNPHSSKTKQNDDDSYEMEKEIEIEPSSQEVAVVKIEQMEPMNQSWSQDQERTYHNYSTEPLQNKLTNQKWMKPEQAFKGLKYDQDGDFQDYSGEPQQKEPRTQNWMKPSGAITVLQEDQGVFPQDYSWSGEPMAKVFVADGALEQLDLEIAWMMERGEDKLWTCKLCGKKATSGGKPDMRDHIEANHIEGIQHCCDFCGKTYK